jgi:hypothetical protein
VSCRVGARPASGHGQAVSGKSGTGRYRRGRAEHSVPVKIEQNGELGKGVWEGVLK